MSSPGRHRRLLLTDLDGLTVDQCNR